MKILYIAPVVPQSSAPDGGYSGIAYSFDRLLRSMLERKELDGYTMINPSTQKESVALNAPYGVMFFTIPFILNTPVLNQGK